MQLTLAVVQRYLMSSEAASAGVAQATAYQFWTEAGHEDPEWADIVPHFRHMSAKEIEPYNLAGNLTPLATPSCNSEMQGT